MDHFPRFLSRWAPGARDAVRRNGVAVAALIAFLLVYLAPFMLKGPALSKIGNDFEILYANYATYSVDAARAGITPLWNPNEGAGYPFYNNPFTAFFYPGRILYFILAAASPVYSWYHHQLYMVAGIVLFALGLYAWLRGRLIDPGAAILAAGVVAIGFRIADIYRFPNAVHAAAWMPWILYAYDKWLDKRIGRGFVFGIFAMVCLGTAGYPYYTVYAAALIASYVALRIGEGVPWRRALTTIATMGIPAAFIVLPYYRSMSKLLSQTVDRTGKSFGYGTLHTWTWTDLLGSLVFPPSAMSEGWLYCGVLPILLVLVWTAVKKPSGAVLLWVVGLTLLVQLFAAGTGSFAFPALWTYAPGVSSLRIWPRMTVILLPPLALLIAVAYNGIVSARVPDRLIQHRVWRIALVIAALQIILLTSKTFSVYYTLYFEPSMPPRGFVTATFVAAIFLTVWTFHRTKASLLWAVLALLVTASDVGVYGRQIWRFEGEAKIPTEALSLRKYYSQFFTVPRKASIGMDIPYQPTYGLMNNWFYGRYAEFVKNYSAQPAFAEFMGSKGRKLFFAQTINTAPENFNEWFGDLIHFEASTASTATPVGQYDGNRLQLKYHTADVCYLIFTDNWDPDWRATLNGKPVPVEQAFGTFKAVHIPDAGDGVVVFEYVPRSRSWWAALLGLILMIAVIVVEILRRRREPPAVEPPVVIEEVPPAEAPPVVESQPVEEAPLSDIEHAVQNRTPESS